MKSLSRNKKIGILSLVALSLTLVGLFFTGNLSFSGLKSNVLDQSCTVQGQAAKLPRYKEAILKKEQAQKTINIVSGEIAVLNNKIESNKKTITEKKSQIERKKSQIANLNTFITNSCKGPLVRTPQCREKIQQRKDLTQDVQILNNTILTLQNTNNQLSQKIQNNQRQISQQRQIIAQQTLFINQYEACEKLLNTPPVLTSPLMSGEVNISGEVLVSGEVIIIGKTLVSGEVLMSGEPCVSGEVRVPLYRLAITQPAPGSADVEFIDFDVAFGNPETLQLADWFITEENTSQILYKCSFQGNAQSQIRCTPGPKTVVTSGTRNFILSTKVKSMTGPGSMKIYKTNIGYNGGKANAENQTSMVKINYAPKPVKTEIQYVSQFGTKGTSDGQFHSPTAISFDAQGNIYVADGFNHRIQKFDNQGKFLIKFGTKGSEDGQFDVPTGVLVDLQGNLYVSDRNNHRIQKFDNQGKFLMKFGSYGSRDGQFDLPNRIKMDLSGNIYVADLGNNRIQKFDNQGKFLMKFGSYGSGDGQFIFGTDIGIDSSGNIYVSDAGNHRIQKFDNQGKFLMKFGSYGSGDGQFIGLRGISTDKLGYIYVSEQENRIQKFDNQGKFLMKFGSYGSGDGQFNSLQGILADNSYIYVVDEGNHRIQKFAQVAVCEDVPKIDFELKRLVPWSEFAPNDLNADKYLFGIEFCVNGSMSVNDLKQTMPAFKYGLPYGYTVIGPNGAVSFDVTAMNGWAEEMKNGQCTRMAISIQPKDQAAFDKAQKLVIALDYDDTVKEINENNNAQEFTIQSCPVFGAPVCNPGEQVVTQPGTDANGCPFSPVCSRSVCPSVCTPLYEISKQCALNTCGSGCGADYVSTFPTLESCRDA